MSTEAQNSVEASATIAAIDGANPQPDIDDDDVDLPNTATTKHRKKDIKPLTVDLISKGISLLARTGNGLSHAYTKLELHNLGLTGIDILEGYSHLRYINLSNNVIQHIECLAGLEYILALDLSDNHLATIPACMEKRKYLQTANLSKNRLTSVNVSGWHLLTLLNLNENKLKEITLHDFPSLMHLEIRANQLTTTSGLQVPSLRRLYLGGNAIESIAELENLNKLNLLHLRDNKLELLNGFEECSKELSYLNLRGNKIAAFVEVEKLASLAGLKTLVLLDNPIASLPSYRLEVLYRLPNLQRLDKDAISDVEREEAEAFKLQLQREAADKAAEEKATADEKALQDDAAANAGLVDDADKDDDEEDT